MPGDEDRRLLDRATGGDPPEWPTTVHVPAPTSEPIDAINGLGEERHITIRHTGPLTALRVHNENGQHITQLIFTDESRHGLIDALLRPGEMRSTPWVSTP